MWGQLQEFAKSYVRFVELYSCVELHELELSCEKQKVDKPEKTPDNTR